MGLLKGSNCRNLEFQQCGRVSVVASEEFLLEPHKSTGSVSWGGWNQDHERRDVVVFEISRYTIRRLGLDICIESLNRSRCLDVL